MIRYLHRILLFGLLAMAVLCSPALAQEKSPFKSPPKPETLPPKPEGQKYRDPMSARCVFVTDGDTIKIRIEGQVENVRLIGVNAPERKDEGWKAARDFVSELCFDKEVRIEFDKVERDRYKRILAYVFVPVAGGEDIFVNGELLRKGHAEYYGYKATNRYSEHLKAIECEDEAVPLLAAVPASVVPLKARPVGPECVFIEEPMLHCEGGWGMSSCSVIAVVKNIGRSPAHYVYVFAVTRGKKSGYIELFDWQAVGGGTLLPDDEGFVKLPRPGSGLMGEGYENEFRIIWTDYAYPVGTGSVFEVSDDVSMIYQLDIEDGPFAQFGMLDISGSVVNRGSAAGFSPTLKARVEDENGRTIKEAYARQPAAPIEPGKGLPFLIHIPDIRKADSERVSLDFVR